MKRWSLSPKSLLHRTPKITVVYGWTYTTTASSTQHHERVSFEHSSYFIYSCLHFVKRYNKTNTGTTQKVSINKSIHSSENYFLQMVICSWVKFCRIKGILNSLLSIHVLVCAINNSLYRNRLFLISQLSVVAVENNPNEDFDSWKKMKKNWIMQSTSTANMFQLKFSRCVGLPNANSILTSHK
jgi:hypothetical protein